MEWNRVKSFLGWNCPAEVKFYNPQIKRSDT